ncbi:hypothetical protein AGABI1DRAFT_93821 [Agaricus bisporus var. burnettii JB137-S8]|uniref:DUF6533 domain-containing protein n=1 Tax=Agaricus bisporus var. burnettii (strain JB137-S8 / ATCC MYA-4627 / FGSC 10392) TaxID=597362 RepID=K5XQ52_AGABU|nr:hypothetical protein AGABI2DRAFT_145182 [Agaricus bisporus var. bisporus H97]XP_007332507.1 uncharacterized protein AGABI1DRAFT_93821 [Agaricus bisporus var. burnettii JB137-S8]EKM76900.1 hypothetical protein AGABI1DRAFT_93821 [Agaricus bisporus var. burnettii JB137-S8]EKV44711.1 hypothetical protein AGABI2DRAFT_145182 [Agaricus bisporus var. bisporus H97]
MTSILNVLHQALGDIQSTRYAFLASSSIIVFDYRLEVRIFDMHNMPGLTIRKVEFIWKKTWSFGKIMFILNRYYPLISVFSFFSKFDGQSSNLDKGRHFVRWKGWTGLIACMLAEVILQTRLYALYSLNNRILALMVSMFLLSSGLSAVVMGKVLADMSISATRFSFDGIEDAFCVPQNISPNFFLFWVPLLVFESLLCGMAVYKGYQSFKAGATMLHSGSRLLSILIRDSVLYFIIIASAYLACLLLWILARQTLLEIPIGFTVAMSCVLANRVILNVREANQSLEEPEIHSIQVMIDENGVRTQFSDIEMAGLRSLRSQTERKFSVM